MTILMTWVKTNRALVNILEGRMRRVGGSVSPQREEETQGVREKKKKKIEKSDVGKGRRGKK